MRTILSTQITAMVSDLCIRANRALRPDVLSRLKSACHREKSPMARKILGAIISNAFVAQGNDLAICQDTGMPCVFIEIGQDVKVAGNLTSAINKGVEAGYRKGYLRSSVILNPLDRGRPGYSPAVIHFRIVRGCGLKLSVLPKGFGCENKAQLKMFNPTATVDEIKRFIIDAVKGAGPDACPPYIVGVGIGGTADYACFLAKKALLKKIAARISGASQRISKLQEDFLKEINRLNIGPMGLGGRTTALGVNIETYPTHIAGLPVAVNISCHALRSASAAL